MEPFHQPPSTVVRRAGPGFTLIELMCVIAVIGLMAAMVIPTWAGVKKNADLERAKACAVTVAVAKDTYLREFRHVARTAWAAAATDGDKYLLIRDYLGASGSSTLATFFPEGYTLRFGDLGADDTLLKGSTPIEFK